MPKAYSIVASNHIDGAEAFIKTLQPGVDAVLVREPTNQYDPNAVAVWIGGRKVGYVPKKMNAVLAAFIDQTSGNAAVDVTMALDKALVAAGPDIKAIAAKFIRSPNSAFPMVEV